MNKSLTRLRSEYLRTRQVISQNLRTKSEMQARTIPATVPPLSPASTVLKLDNHVITYQYKQQELCYPSLIAR